MQFNKEEDHPDGGTYYYCKLNISSTRYDVVHSWALSKSNFAYPGLYPYINYIANDVRISIGSQDPLEVYMWLIMWGAYATCC
jgi:hypothetical protein